MKLKLFPTNRVFAVGETSIKFRNAGTFSTVTIAVPMKEPLLALTIAVPGFEAMNLPELSTVPTVTLLLDQVTEAVNALPYWSFGEAVNVKLSPTKSVFVVGRTWIRFRNGGTFSTVMIAVPV